MKSLQRPVIWLACFFLGALVHSLIPAAHVVKGKPSSPPFDNTSKNQRPDINAGNLSPEEVVAEQICAMREALVAPERLADCYSFASPENRKQTGPFSRFATMVMRPPYDYLARSSTWQIGRATIERDHASVVVSTYHDDQEWRAYRFLLRRYEQPPYHGCWLTESVRVLEPLGTQELEHGSTREEGLRD